MSYIILANLVLLTLILLELTLYRPIVDTSSKVIKLDMLRISNPSRPFMMFGAYVG